MNDELCECGHPLSAHKPEHGGVSHCLACCAPAVICIHPFVRKGSARMSACDEMPTRGQIEALVDAGDLAVQHIASLTADNTALRKRIDYLAAEYAPIHEAQEARIRALAADRDSHQRVAIELTAAVLRYARHDRECPYPDHDCACGLAPIITSLIGDA